MSFKNTWKTRGICFTMAYGIYYLLRDYCNEVLVKLLFNNMIIELTNNIFVDIILFFMLMMIPTNILHEWLHGITYKFFGGKVKYAFKGIYIQAQEVSKMSIHRTKYLVILLMPVTVITLLSLIISGWIGGIIFILNLFKSTGDILKVIYLCKTNSSSSVVEKKYGFDIVDMKSEVQLTFENL